MTLGTLVVVAVVALVVGAIIYRWVRAKQRGISNPSCSSCSGCSGCSGCNTCGEHNRLSEKS